MRLLYLSSWLPKRSETFVYTEVLGLRTEGVQVAAASLYEPESDLGDPDVDALAGEVFTLYTRGMGALLADALLWSATHPFLAISVLMDAGRIASRESDIPPGARPKVFFQGVAALALAWRVRKYAPTHLHVHMAHAPATVGMFLARALKIPFSMTGHAADIFRDRILLAAKLQSADFVACISEWHRDWYRTIHDADDRHYPVIRCGVEVPLGAVVKDNWAEGDPIRILGLGRLVEKKGFDLLIEACRILEARGIRLECVIAGDGPERSALESLARGMQITFPGAVAHRTVPTLMAGCDLFVLPCRVGNDGDRDGIPVVLMEAMARGRAVVAGDLPAIRELITPERTGLLVPPGDAAALAEAIARAAADRAFCLRLGEAGRDRVIEEFSSPVNLARLQNAFEQ